MILGFPKAKQELCHTKHGGAGGIILWALLTVFLVFFRIWLFCYISIQKTHKFLSINKPLHYRHRHMLLNDTHVQLYINFLFQIISERFTIHILTCSQAKKKPQRFARPFKLTVAVNVYVKDQQWLSYLPNVY